MSRADWPIAVMIYGPIILLAFVIFIAMAVYVGAM